MKTSKILFISTVLGSGGAERIMLYLLNFLADRKDLKIILLLLEDKNNDYLRYLSEDVEIINLSIKKRIRYSFFSILKTIASINPSICYVGLDILNPLIALMIPFFKAFRFYKIKFIVRETNILSKKYDFSNMYTKNVYKYFYNLYDTIISQSNDMCHDLVVRCHINKQKIVKINNPVDVEFIEAHKKNIGVNDCDIIFNRDKVNIVAVGRLTYQKGYDILFERLSECKKVDYNVYILGRGELENNLRQLSKELNIVDKVHFLGHVNNPYYYMNKADFIVLSSRYEGFPNVLLEANALGKPVFVNKCLGGINEIVIEGINGYSACFEDTVSFQTSFALMQNTDFNSMLIKESVKKRYALDVIMPQYEYVFNKFL